MRLSYTNLQIIAIKWAKTGVFESNLHQCNQTYAKIGAQTLYQYLSPLVVEHRRFELLTPTLPVLCATSCANAPNNVYIITLQMICKGVKSSFFKFLQKNHISAKAVLSRWTSRLLFSYVEERKVLPQPLFAQKKRPESLILQNCGCPKMPLCPIFSPAMYSRPVPCGALAAVPWRDNSGA